METPTWSTNSPDGPDSLARLTREPDALVHARHSLGNGLDRTRSAPLYGIDHARNIRRAA